MLPRVEAVSLQRRRSKVLVDRRRRVRGEVGSGSSIASVVGGGGAGFLKFRKEIPVRWRRRRFCAGSR
jgi:hypothetical protein